MPNIKHIIEEANEDAFVCTEHGDCFVVSFSSAQEDYPHHYLGHLVRNKAVELKDKLEQLLQ